MLWKHWVLDWTKCAQDERQKQEFWGLCACQHASPSPNLASHQALCESKGAFSWLCAVDGKGKFFSGNWEQDCLWVVATLSGKSSFSSTYSRCWALLSPTGGALSQGGQPWGGGEDSAFQFPFFFFKTVVGSTSQESSSPCCSLFKAGRRTLLMVTT